MPNAKETETPVKPQVAFWLHHVNLEIFLALEILVEGFCNMLLSAGLAVFMLS